jgi:hypothetical protein
MVTNIAIDTFVGSIPIFGDAFDFAYKSNLKSVAIYRRSIYAGRAETARHWAFFGLLFLGIEAVCGIFVYRIIALVRAIV